MQEEETLSGERNGLQRLPAITHHSVMYAPKALVLVSRLDYFVTFRVGMVCDPAPPPSLRRGARLSAPRRAEPGEGIRLVLSRLA